MIVLSFYHGYPLIPLALKRGFRFKMTLVVTYAKYCNMLEKIIQAWRYVKAGDQFLVKDC